MDQLVTVYLPFSIAATEPTPFVFGARNPQFVTTSFDDVVNNSGQPNQNDSDSFFKAVDLFVQQATLGDDIL